MVRRSAVEEALNLATGVAGVVEGDEEALGAATAAHRGLEGVNIRGGGRD